MPDVLSPARVADYLLCESRERGELLTNLKLQKLLYYAQAWFLVVAKTPLFAEDFQAWVHGPVLPSQYHRFREYRWNAITSELGRPEMSEGVEKHLAEILEVFGPESAIGLELMTHRERPWIEARGQVPPDEPSTAVIPKAAMAEFYASL